MERRSSLRELFNQVPLPTKYKKQKIPVALREAVWITRCGRVFEHKCLTSWCPNTITVFDFQSGHNIPESKGGKTCIENLYPLCCRCNVSMGDRYTFDEWTAMHMPVASTETTPKTGISRYFSCFSKTQTRP
jgi:HNH endonuclease